MQFLRKHIFLRHYLHVLGWLAVAYGAWCFVPSYSHALRYRMVVYETARDAATYRWPDESIRESLMDKARRLDLRVEQDDLHIVTDPETRRVTVTVFYGTSTQLLRRNIDLHFSAHSSQAPMVNAEDVKGSRKAQSGD